jgi:amidase
MSTFPEYSHYDGLGLAELVRTGQVPPAELVEAAIERIEALNPQLNAVVNKMYDQARAAVAQGLPEGLFRGVPFLLKDLNGNVAGVPTGSGNRLLRNIPAPRDSEMVRRFRKAGLVVMGKTNTPEFGLVPYTEPETYGPTHNPWDLTRSPGGSSGGSAAAVAARLVPLASGGDGGGSIRIPGSCCGVFGLKPSRGRTPLGPDVGESWRGFVVEHALTRSVRDSAAILDATAGADVGAPYDAPPAPESFLAEVSREPGRLRIAYTAHPFMGKDVHADCREGLQRTARLLEGLGHEVCEAVPEIDGAQFSVAFLTVIMAECRADVEWAAGLAGRKPRLEDFDPSTYAMGLLGKSMSAADYASAVRYLQVAARAVGRFFTDYDVLLTPTLAQPPAVIGSLQPPASQIAQMRVIGKLNAGWVMKAMGVVKPLAAQTFQYMPYTPLFNVTGQPAVSMPLHWNAAGLPIGMQFVGRFGDEATLFRLAGQIERAQPWAERVPAMAQ